MMVCPTGCKGWRAGYPFPVSLTNVKRQAQAFVKGAEVIDTPQQAHTCFQCLWFTGQVAGAASQNTEPLAEGGIQAFNEGGIDDTTALSGLQKLVNYLLTALNNAPLNRRVAK